MRAPVGGLFRHVRDLARGQAERGHAVGILCDSRTGGASADAAFADLAGAATLGIRRIDMGRQIGLADYAGYREAVALGSQHSVDIVHGHGGKGGAYARLAARSLKQQGRKLAAFYTPHGGSLHYQPGTPAGFLYLGLEKLLAPITDGLIFESAYSARIYAEKVGTRAAMRVVPNGLGPEEFSAHQPHPDAVDFLFVGELRVLKGVDLLIGALADIAKARPVTALIVGDGPDRARFEAQVAAFGLTKAVTFAGLLPARQAFPRARAIIVPSRAESFPYIVLEAAAACLPLVATDVGGIPEIVDGTDIQLVKPDDQPALVQSMLNVLSDLPAAQARAHNLQTAVHRRFTVAAMTDAVINFYGDRLVC